MQSQTKAAYIPDLWVEVVLEAVQAVHFRLGDTALCNFPFRYQALMSDLGRISVAGQLQTENHLYLFLNLRLTMTNPILLDCSERSRSAS